MTAAKFYAADHLGRAYGVRVLGVPHSGQDVNRWAPGTLIPSPASGTVAKKGKSTRYGYWVAVRLPDGSYLGAAHMLTASPLIVGAPVKVNTTLGKLGNTGTYSFGPHTHIYYSSVPEPWGRPTKDPIPIIQSAMTQPIVKDTDMPYLIYNAPTGSHAERRAWYVPGVKFDIIDTPTAVVKAKTMKQLLRLPSTTPTTDVTTNFTDEMWDDALTDVSAGVGGYNPADADVIDEAEGGQLATSAVSLTLDGVQTIVSQAVEDINAHTTQCFAEQFV